MPLLLLTTGVLFAAAVAWALGNDRVLLRWRASTTRLFMVWLLLAATVHDDAPAARVAARAALDTREKLASCPAGTRIDAVAVRVSGADLAGTRALEVAQHGLRRWFDATVARRGLHCPNGSTTLCLALADLGAGQVIVAIDRVAAPRPLSRAISSRPDRRQQEATWPEATTARSHVVVEGVRASVSSWEVTHPTSPEEAMTLVSGSSPDRPEGIPDEPPTAEAAYLSCGDPVSLFVLATGVPSILGRSQTATIVLDDVKNIASKRHASVGFDDGCWWITDLGSTNGTLVNGRRTNQVRLADGDTVQFGDGGIALKFHQRVPVAR